MSHLLGKLIASIKIKCQILAPLEIVPEPMISLMVPVPVMSLMECVPVPVPDLHMMS